MTVRVIALRVMQRSHLLPVSRERSHACSAVKDMDLPGLRLHQLVGNRSGVWSVTVSGNWRVTFRFEDGDAEIVNYEDYH
ncbi:MAG: hypothetical protein CME36_11000 [unclassified Hahellaceae]|nr:hypothetical protein [Hahellaceae bacterium]